MKDVRYISIQGWNASAFWFRNNDAHNFRSLIESITLRSCLIVSSLYRTDIFYHSPEDKTEVVLRMWCAFRGLNYNSEIRKKFILENGPQASMSAFFESLAHLKHHPQHYKSYKKQLNQLILHDQTNLVIREIIGCDEYLVKDSKEKDLSYLPLTRRRKLLIRKSQIIKNLHIVANRFIGEVIFN